jgi:putative endonuclease
LSRPKARRFGRAAEWAAALHLRCLGYRVLARSYRVRGGEIDIIARRGPLLVFVEVKARPNLKAAQIAIMPAQRQRIARAAAVWLTSHPTLATTCDFRGDAIFVAPWRWPRHCPGAFELTGL